MCRFSVVIPTFERLDLLANCLGQLAPTVQTIDPLLYEVIVTDDGRKQSAQSLIESQFPWATWTMGPARGPAANRNHGASLARGQWLAFIDDDCLAHPQWLSSMATLIEQSSVDVIEGKTIIPDFVDSPVFQAPENLHGDCLWTCNLTVRQQLFATLGGFDEDFLQACQEDMELAWRLKKHQAIIVFSEQTIVYHPVRHIGWTGVLRQIKLIRWKRLYALKTGQSLSLTQHPAVVALWLIKEEVMVLIRSPWHLIKKIDLRSWRSQTFVVAWMWITFPYVLPYLLIWEFRYRNQLLERKKNSPADQ